MCCYLYVEQKALLFALSHELFLDKKALLRYTIIAVLGSSWRKCATYSVSTGLSPEFVRSSKTFTTTSAVVKVFFYNPCFAIHIIWRY